MNSLRLEFLSHFGLDRDWGDLRGDDLPPSFVYCRKYGVSWVAAAHHELVMGAIVWTETNSDFSDWRKKWETHHSLFTELAMTFLDEWDGACYRSSVTMRRLTISEVGTVKGHGLDRFEKMQFEDLEKDWIGFSRLKEQS